MKIEPDIIRFLKDLNNNNDREWFAANKPIYESVRQNFQEFVTALIAKFTPIDPEIASLDARKCIFRIYRDVRFSKDKSPYKTNIGAYIMPGGTKDRPTAGHYLHIEPGKSFVGGGAYMPDALWLKNIREAIDYDANELIAILDSSLFKKYFNGIEGEQLKKIPKGYAADHEHIALLKYKSFTAVRYFTDDEVMASNFINHILKCFTALKPFNDFLNKSIQ